MHNTHAVPLKVDSLQPTSSVSPQDQNIDPAIAGSGIMGTSTGESGGDENGSDGKKIGKRALSTSKRAAQNRQAQVSVTFILIFVDICSFKFFHILIPASGLVDGGCCSCWLGTEGSFCSLAESWTWRRRETLTNI